MGSLRRIRIFTLALASDLQYLVNIIADRGRCPIMYVCICNAINCKTVRHSVNNGASSVAGVFKACGKTPQCGRCFTTIREMVGDASPANNCADHIPAIAAE